MKKRKSDKQNEIDYFSDLKSIGPKMTKEIFEDEAKFIAWLDAALEEDEQLKGWFAEMDEANKLFEKWLETEEGDAWLKAEVERSNSDPEDIESEKADVAPKFDPETIEVASPTEKLIDEVEIPKITVKRVNNLIYPLDKTNSTIWNNVEQNTPDGKTKLAIRMKKGEKGVPDISYTLDFYALDDMEELNITRKLTHFDKRVFLSIATLYDNGNDIISITQICKTMGYGDRNPGSNILEKVRNSVFKMRFANIKIDTRVESEKYGYAVINQEGYLLPAEPCRVEINGQVVHDAIHVLSRPVLLRLAETRKQLTVIPQNVLESPFSKTEGFLAIDDYLQLRISRMKNSKNNASNKILFSKIFERCKITDARKKTRAKGTVKGLLEFYESIGFIKGLEVKKDGVIIKL